MAPAEPRVLAGTAFVAALVLGRLLLPLLRRLKLGQQVRDQGPARHRKKAGTPTMGGLIFLLPVAGLGALSLGAFPEVRLALVVSLGFGALGLADDLLKVVFHRPLGLRARYKLVVQLALGLLLGVGALALGRSSLVQVPVLGLDWDLGPLYAPFAALVVIGAANAVNLADGLDGLVAGSAILAFLAYVILAAGVGAPALAAFAGLVVGAVAGFLPYNLHPARVFMGDTGALGLGAALGAVAVLTRTELVLPLLGGLYVLEALSVMVQVAVFQTTGRRGLLMSPLHHHFELAGWTEEQVVYRFWAAAAVFALVGLAAARTLSG